MSEYTPHRWVIVEIESQKYGKIQKILASWYGGFAGSDSWKLSSGNTDKIDNGDFYTFPQESGSTYICDKKYYGMSSYTMGVYAGFETHLKETTSTIRILDEAEVISK